MTKANLLDAIIKIKPNWSKEILAFRNKSDLGKILHRLQDEIKQLKINNNNKKE